MRRFSGLVAAVAIGCVVFPANAQAHPGHAHEVVSSQSGWHWLVQPEHAATLLVAAAVLVYCMRKIQRAVNLRRMKLAPVTVRRRRDL